MNLHDIVVDAAFDHNLDPDLIMTAAKRYADEEIYSIYYLRGLRSDYQTIEREFTITGHQRAALGDDYLERCVKFALREIDISNELLEKEIEVI